MLKKRWQIAKKTTDDIVDQLLLNRGLETKEEQSDFLNPYKPTLENILKHSSIDSDYLRKAVIRIKKAIENKEKIIIYGDYDADGITGTTILWETIYYLGGDCLPYIPDRESEGYGLNETAIHKLAEKETKLIITTDCGVTNTSEVEIANSFGIDVIISDHHQKEETFPDALAIIHDDTLVGASVAWVLAMSIEKEMKGDSFIDEGQRLDLVAIGTIADLQPLKGKNRSFTKWGLQEMNKTKRIGLQAIIKQSGLNLGDIEAYHIGYVIAPRFNAAGRLHDALHAVRLLCTKDQLQSLSLAESLTKLNIKRQEMTKLSYEQANVQLDKFKEEKAFILNHDEWHEGIIGLIAARIKEKYYRPTIAISTQGKVGKGSARSIKGFNIIDALRELEHLLLKVGGHPMAAGFSIEIDKIDQFRKSFTALAQEKISDETLEPIVTIDAKLELPEIDWDLYGKIITLAPFGAGNEEPTFLLEGIKIKDCYLIGKDKNHLKIIIDRPGQSPLEALGFGLGDYYETLSKDQNLDIAFMIKQNEWRGKKKLVIRIKDLRISNS